MVDEAKIQARAPFLSSWLRGQLPCYKSKSVFNTYYAKQISSY